MGNIDSIPVVSQTKSAVQAIVGDTEGARRTQQNFLRGCPIVSQGTSAVQAIAGDTDGARKTQEYFASNLSQMVDSVPVVGHIKGGIHYAVGDIEGGHNAMFAASRTTAVLGGGIAGGLLGGPVGAIAGGIAGGAGADGIFTGVDSAVHGEFRPHGHVQMGHNAVTGNMDAGSAFDWAMMPFFDGLAGRGGYAALRSMRAKLATRSLRAAVTEAVASGEITLAEGESITSLVDNLKAAAAEAQKAVKSAGKNANVENTVTSVVIDVEGTKHTGYSYSLRTANNIVDAFHGDVPSVLQKLNKRFRGGRRQVRGEAKGEPQCSEWHALHKHHATNGVEVNPARTISVVYDGRNIRAIARCDNCAKISQWVDLGSVPTDALDGTVIHVNEVEAFDTVAGLLSTLACDCEDGGHKNGN